MEAQQCQNGACTNVPAPDGTSCSDGGAPDPCVVDIVCQQGNCTRIYKDCSAFDGECCVGGCDSNDGTCLSIPLVDGSDCVARDECGTRDGFCNLLGTCQPRDAVCPQTFDPCVTGFRCTTRSDGSSNPCGEIVYKPEGTFCGESMTCQATGSGSTACKCAPGTCRSGDICVPAPPTGCLPDIG